MTDADENTRLSRRGPDPSEQPEDSTQLVSRRDRRNAAAGLTDETVIVPRAAAPAAVPADETVIVDRAPSDEPDDGTLLVRRPDAAPAADATIVTSPAASQAEPLDGEDDHTILTPRRPVAEPLDADDTVLRPRDEPKDETLLRRRDRPADADADADDTVLRARDAVVDDATSLSSRSPEAGAGPRLTRARRGASRQTASFAPDAATDRTPARERYAIRTPTIGAAPATVVETPVVDVGDGGLAARIARRRTVRTRLMVLAAVSSIVFVGAIVGLATLLSI